MATREEQITAIRAAAEELGVDPDLAQAVGEQESGFNPQAISRAGARGTMQVMPATAAEMRRKYGEQDPIRTGVRYLKERLDEYGDIEDEALRRSLALAAYNAGPGRVGNARMRAKRRGLDDRDFAAVSRFLPRETRDYVPGVLGRIKGRATEVAFDPSAVDVKPDMLFDQPEDDSDIRALAEGVEGASEDDSDIRALAAESDESRSFGENVYGRTVGRVASAADRALGGLPSTLAGVAGAASAGDEAGITQALKEGGGTGHRALNVGLGLLELALTGKFPAAAALSAGAGAGLEAATGSETAGNVAEVAAGVAPGAAAASRAVAGRLASRGAETTAPTVERMVASELGAGTTAQEAGRALQRPGQGARGAITKTAEESGRLYEEAATAGRAAGAQTTEAGAKSLFKTARAAEKVTRKLPEGLPSGVHRAVRDVMRLARGMKSRLVMPGQGKTLAEQAATAKEPTAVRGIGVDELIEAQSNLRRMMNKLPRDHRAKEALLELDTAIERQIDRAAKDAPEVMARLGRARRRYRETTIPTRKTASRLIRAETPEAAARQLTAGKQPSKFGRIARVEPDVAADVRSAFWTDMIEGSKQGGAFNVDRFAAKIDKLDPKQLKQMADTPAKQKTVKAVQRLARLHKTVREAPLAGGAAGSVGGLPGAIVGFATGRVIKSALTSDRVANALYRYVTAPEGAVKAHALKALKRAMGSQTVGATTRAALGVAQEE